MDSTKSLINKTAIITGASQSIGLAIARRFISAGATVIVADVQPPPDDDLLYCKCDISLEKDVIALMDFAKQHGDLQILVNNAGIGLESTISKTEVCDWDKLMAVNVRGVFLCAKHAFALMCNKGGSIINIGSIEGNGANPMHASYAASKGAVHALTRNIALEYGKYHIRCNAIAPGWIDTPFNQQLLQQYADVESTRRAIENLHPVRRMGTGEDIANLALFLAGDESSFASGQVFVLDGGRTACLPLPPL